MKRRTLRGELLSAAACLAGLLLSGSAALADSPLRVLEVRLDEPTLIALGVQVLVSGDENRSASVAVRFRRAGEQSWKEALPLHRVDPSAVAGWEVPHQFAGSIFDLRPATTYDIELRITDPESGLDETRNLSGTTRAVPRAEPANPRRVDVHDAASLRAALAAARRGDVIVLAEGIYRGSYSIAASGDAENPIVIRGASREGTALDGDGCNCNVLDVSGSYVTVENLTIREATRAIRFSGEGAVGNVVRRVRIYDTTLGIGSNGGQRSFYLCDNELQGRLSWPQIYADGPAHANDDGIHVEGDGHVVCHNLIVGYGDALKTEEFGARALDFYGNEVLSAYDNAIELDLSEGNARCLRNRFTNSYSPVSFQPILGGPVYVMRNVAVNIIDEQLKFHALALNPPREPNGIYVYNNTFVSSIRSLQMSTDATSHHFVIENNLFIGPANPDRGRVVEWYGGVHDGRFDYNGYYPDGIFAMNSNAGYQRYDSFAQLQAGGVETHGVLLGADNFVSGLRAPGDWRVSLEPPDATLDPDSRAVDRGRILPNVNDLYTGAAPDLGALERGCPLPIYGVRPAGVDESNEPFGCAPDRGGDDPADPADPGDDDPADPGDDDPADPGDDEGTRAATGEDRSEDTGCAVAAGGGVSWPLSSLLIVGLLPLLRRRR